MLESMINVEFVETRVGEAFGYLEGPGGIASDPDWAGADKARPVTARLGDVPAVDACDLILRLGWLVGETERGRLRMRPADRVAR